MTIEKHQVVLINLYAPNEDHEMFFKNIFDMIVDSVNCHLIIGGDFNAHLKEIDDAKRKLQSQEIS